MNAPDVPVNPWKVVSAFLVLLIICAAHGGTIAVMNYCSSQGEFVHGEY